MYGLSAKACEYVSVIRVSFTRLVDLNSESELAEVTRELFDITTSVLDCAIEMFSVTRSVSVKGTTESDPARITAPHIVLCT